MDKDQLGLTEVEKLFLERSYDSAITRRRIRQVVLAASFFAALLLTLAWLSKSWALVLLTALVYLVITVWEKVAYGRGVLVYKSVICKLARRVEELGG